MKDNQQNSCKQCTKCCHFEIPITLLDIHRLAKHLCISDESVFKRNIQKGISEKSSLFKLAKKQDSSCIFLNKEGKCSIHKAKPNVCKLYMCSLASNDLPWTAYCNELSDKAVLWEQKIATMISRQYIKKNGNKWNDIDYQKALSNILGNIVVSDHQKIKLARCENNNVLHMIYDCSKCNSMGECAVETPVTIDDIDRIITYLKKKWDDFFKNYIKPLPSSSGTFLLKRNKHCIFFNSELHCTISQVRPLHCRYTPCPKKTLSSSQFDCLYLGSGTIEEQFRHQVAIRITKDYISQYGTKYHKKGIKAARKSLIHITSGKIGFKEFCRQISPFRYVDDTLPNISN